MKNKLHCQFCGIRIKSDSKFCEGCGERLDENGDYSKNYQREKMQFSKMYPDYQKRILEIFIIFNIASVLYSLSINWGYFNSEITLWNVIITGCLSLVNIILLFELHNGKIIFLYGMGVTAVISFIFLLGEHILMNLFIISLLEFLIFYFIIFWFKHQIKE
ncbi:zinc ribbon domain-containing protein [Candidatus Pacearchaeota archaeon]|nr:zinc ribbon domain-containing protein [Candidatus Pacearchaeota archaeon]